jgi:hypothetical protein
MRTKRNSGTILLTAIFVLFCIHALVTVILAALRHDTALLQGSDRRQEAALRAQSGIECALDLLRDSGGPAWETAHTTTAPPPYPEPPAAADEFILTGDEKVKVWVHDPASGDTLRHLWAAAWDGRKWQSSSVVAVRREVHPGLIFGVQNSIVADKVYYRGGDGSGGWEATPPPQTIDPASGAQIFPTAPAIIHGDADLEGRFFVVQREQLGPGAGHRVLAFDTTRGTNGEWGSMPELPAGFQVDPAGLAVASDTVYVIGSAGLSRSILSHPVGGSLVFLGEGPVTTAWTTVQTLPSALLVDGAPVLLPYSTTSLQAAEDGTLYMHFTFVEPDPKRSAFARLKDGSWSFFAPPKNVISSEALGGFRPLELDDLGSPLTYAAEAGAPTKRGFFRFVSEDRVEGVVLKGQWKKLPGISVDDPPLGVLRCASIDAQGRLFMGVRDPSDPQVFNFHQVKSYPLRSSRHDVPATWTLPSDSDALQIVRAGGRPSTGQLEYVPVNWF